MKLYAAPLNFRAIAREFDVPTDFAPALHAEASGLVDRFADARIDARDIPVVTIDPAGSKDLDQAVYVEKRSGGGFRVQYAIADVAAFVDSDSGVHEESLQRGQTIYLPDEPARLHPEEVSEGSASLLPDVDRPAVLWTFDLDGEGEVESAHVERALVHSVARLDYEGVHASLTDGSVHPSIALLPEVGRLRQQSSLRRHAINLRVPSVRVARDGDAYELAIEPRCLPICAGTPVPKWVTRDAARMLKTMGRSSQLANTVEKACLHLTEATVLEPWVGHNFDGVTLKSGEEQSRVFIVDPPVLAPSAGAPEEGVSTKFSLVHADTDAREVGFAWPAD